jgi:hypothetical protein
MEQDLMASRTTATANDDSIKTSTNLQLQLQPPAGLHIMTSSS